MPARKLMVVLLLLPVASVARGQTRAGRLGELEKKVDALAKSSADGSAALLSAQELQRRLVELEKRAKAARAVDRGYTALRAQLDDLVQRLGDLQLQLTAVSLRSAEESQLLYDRGLVLRVGRSVEARLTGLVQAGYAGRLVSEEHDYSGDAALGRNGSEITLPRARLETSGHVFDPRLSYVLGLEFGALADQTLLDAFVQFGTPRIGARVGLMRVPFGRQFALDLAHLLFDDRSGPTLAFYPGRDVGLRLHGALFDSERFGRVGVEMGIFNGGGKTPFRDGNTDFLYAARVVYEPLGALGSEESDARRSSRPRLAIGGSFMYDLAPTDAALRAGVKDPAISATLQDANGDGDVDNVGIASVAGELALLWRGLSVQGEIFYRHEDPGAVAAGRSYWGAYGQLAARHGSGLEAAARYGYWERHRYGEDGDVMAPASMHEIAVALTAWQWRDALKLQTSYAYRLLQDIGDRHGNAATADSLRAHLLAVSVQLAW